MMIRKLVRYSRACFRVAKKCHEFSQIPPLGRSSQGQGWHRAPKRQAVWRGTGQDKPRHPGPQHPQGPASFWEPRE